MVPTKQQQMHKQITIKITNEKRTFHGQYHPWEIILLTYTVLYVYNNRAMQQQTQFPPEGGCTHLLSKVSSELVSKLER